MDKAVALTCVPVAAPPIPDSAVADGPLLLCAGRGSLFATVSADRVAIINRALEAVFSWTPHHSHVAHILCLRSENRILTVGDDSNGIPQLRIWNLDKIDKSTNAPLLIRTITVQVNNRVFPVTAVAALESLTQIAVGLENGVVLLVRGDVGNPSRQQLKMKAVCEAGQVITGLGFKEQQSPKTEGPMQTLLYITTPSSVLMCDSTSSKEILTTIDERYGAELSCGIPTPFRDPCAAMVTARNDGIYFYDANGRGSCFMIESEKTMISWFRNYLVVVSRPSMQTSVSTLGRKSVTSPKTSSFSIKKTEVDEADEPGLGTVLTVYDLRCKFIAFHGVFDTGVAKGKRSSGIVSVASEWDELFVTTADRKMYRLEEIDMTLRLEYLFSKNMYTLALAVVNAPEGSVLPLPVSSSISGAANIDRLPNSAESDTLPLQIEIHRRHGDYLYSTGEFAPAMTQYLHTLSHLEPSYVIRKYLSANLTPLLATFLETLHTHTYMHLATHDHTTLLINCYTKMPNAHALLDAFLARTDVAFDVETVVAVCRGAGFASHAANLARRFGMHEAYLDVVIEDLKDYSHAVGYMVDGLSPATMEACLRRYGGVLVREMASEMSDLLVVVCTTTREDTEEDEIGDALTSGDDMTASMAATVENGGMILMGQRRKTNPKIIS
ncbi:Vacuolar protein sorting-associated protein 11, partial [Entophlyctis luteolus]